MRAADLAHEGQQAAAEYTDDREQEQNEPLPHQQLTTRLHVAQSTDLFISCQVITFL